MTYISEAQEALIRASALVIANGDVSQRDAAVSNALLKAADEFHGHANELEVQRKEHRDLTHRVKLLEALEK
jgi:hypothetical protein